MFIQVKITSILLLYFIFQSCFKDIKKNNLDNITLEESIGKLSDTEKYAATLSYDIKKDIHSIIDSSILQSPESTHTLDIDIASEKIPSNRDQEHIFGIINLIIVDLYHIFYHLHKSIAPQLATNVSLEEYSYNVMRNVYLCSYTIKEEQPLCDVLKKYYKIPIEQYANGENNNFDDLQKSVNVGRMKVYEILKNLLNNKEYIKKNSQCGKKKMS